MIKDLIPKFKTTQIITKWHFIKLKTANSVLLFDTNIMDIDIL